MNFSNTFNLFWEQASYWLILGGLISGLMYQRSGQFPASETNFRRPAEAGRKYGANSLGGGRKS